MNILIVSINYYAKGFFSKDNFMLHTLSALIYIQIICLFQFVQHLIVVFIASLGWWMATDYIRVYIGSKNALEFILDNVEMILLAYDYPMFKNVIKAKFFLLLLLF